MYYHSQILLYPILSLVKKKSITQEQEVNCKIHILNAFKKRNNKINIKIVKNHTEFSLNSLFEYFQDLLFELQHVLCLLQRLNLLVTLPRPYYGVVILIEALIPPDIMVSSHVSMVPMLLVEEFYLTIVVTVRTLRSRPIFGKLYSKKSTTSSAFMIMNIWICLSLIFGSALGHFIVAWLFFNRYEEMQ